MKKLKRQETILGSITPPINSDENSGVKDQHLFMDRATLNIAGNATIENTLVTRDLKVSDTATSSCEFIVGSNLSAENSQFNATTLSSGVNIYSQTQAARTPICNNISDPKSARDAITFNYYKKTGCQAANLCIYYPKGYQITAGGSIQTNASSVANKTVNLNATPSYSEYMDMNPIVKLKRVGIYQVTMQLTRWDGQHDGENTASLLLNLMSGNSKIQLCTSDTRGNYWNDRTSVAVTGTFSLTEIVASPPYDHPWINLESVISISLMSVSTCVIWFPFDSNFFEVD